jgi:phospholipase C
VVISPYVPAGTIDTTVRDHSAVPTTVRQIFTPNAQPLTARDQWAQPFHTLLSLADPRRNDLPDLSRFIGPSAPGLPPVGPARVSGDGQGPVPQSYQPFLTQAEHVRRKLVAVRETEAVATPVRATAPSDRAAEITEIFAAAAQRHRDQLGTPPGSL